MCVCASEPALGPKVSVLAHKAGRVLIQWDELPVYQRRGFITNYTIYVQKYETDSAEVRGELLCVCISMCSSYIK